MKKSEFLNYLLLSVFLLCTLCALIFVVVAYIAFRLELGHEVWLFSAIISFLTGTIIAIICDKRGL